MAGIGEDIKDVLQELGTPFKIIHVNGDSVEGESLDYEMYFEQSTEFIRQHCYSGDFQYDTEIVQGDLIEFDSKKFLMMNVKRTLFENEVVDYSNFFVETNVLGRFSSSVEVRDPITLKKNIVWPNIYEIQHITDATPVENDIYELTWDGVTLVSAALGADPTTADLAEALRVSNPTDYADMPFILTDDTDALVLTWKKIGVIEDLVSMVKSTGSGTPVASVYTIGRASIPANMSVLAPMHEEMGEMKVTQDKYTLFVQGFSYIKAGDRWYPDLDDPEEYYKILSVDKYRFTGLLSIKLIEDIRE